MSPRRIAKALAIFGTFALATLFTATIWIVRHRNSAQAMQTVADMVPGTLLHAHNFHWTQMKANHLQWVLTASDASYAADRSSLLLTNPDLQMTSDDGKAVRVDAPRAVIALNGSHVTRADLSGGTVIHFGDFVVTTDAASYMPDEDRVEAPGGVTIEGEGLKVTGIGLTGDPKARKFELHQQVTTDIVPKKDSEKVKAS
ncbi:MAG TPA: LPS export ABC transporter periplasmic protein LptC [Candidatus Binataceae bacterium]|nr:LPS export ABC transporter periplasmic protein LptC [Candidatus Binataceae bacterium]